MENKVNEEDHSLSHPPGFTPEVDQFEGQRILGSTPGIIANAIRILWVQKNQASEFLKKQESKWAIEGDEESAILFHGILNKKRSQSQDFEEFMANGV
ncbi:hypothetical protein Tco_0828175 [Tanacetum coccineum]